MVSSCRLVVRTIHCGCGDLGSNLTSYIFVNLNLQAKKRSQKKKKK